MHLLLGISYTLFLSYHFMFLCRSIAGMLMGESLFSKPTDHIAREIVLNISKSHSATFSSFNDSLAENKSGHSRVAMKQ